MIDEEFKVSEEGFDVEELRIAAREGRLFMIPRRTVPDKQSVIINVRAYVARIERMVAPDYRTTINCIWNRLFEIETLADMMMPKPKSRKFRDFDKYTVMSVVGILIERGVYQYHTQREYCCALEQITREEVDRCSYRSYLGAGLADRQLLKEIRRIVDESKF